ncbi:MAG: hypothetical protein WCY09_10570 [Candidatus Omnitrophota bacterium]|jgi:hypothetical protein
MTPEDISNLLNPMDKLVVRSDTIVKVFFEPNAESDQYVGLIQVNLKNETLKIQDQPVVYSTSATTLEALDACTRMAAFIRAVGFLMV